MKKRILTVALAAAFLFAGALLFQVENADAQTAAVADEAKLGKWIAVYGGDATPKYEKCFAHRDDECLVGDKRKPQVVAGPAVPVNN